ncbi:MAG: hypothetical protein KJZ80_08780 [Hyphomicrobiaceae bacterium]|nr:hypothetical protein [Hyphomicrobiaceae bacterium]
MPIASREPRQSELGRSADGRPVERLCHEVWSTEPGVPGETYRQLTEYRFGIGAAS